MIWNKQKPWQEIGEQGVECKDFTATLLQCPLPRTDPKGIVANSGGNFLSKKHIKTDRIQFVDTSTQIIIIF